MIVIKLLYYYVFEIIKIYNAINYNIILCIPNYPVF